MTNQYSTFENKIAYPFCFQRQSNGFAVPRHIFLEKLAPSSHKYNALEAFREEIEVSKAGFHHQPYTSQRKSVTLYRSIFLANSIAFLILAIFAISLPSTIHTGLFLGSLTTVKSVVIGICSMFSIASLTIGIVLQAEKEAVYQAIKRAKTHLSRIHQRKSLKVGFKRHLLFGKERMYVKALRQMYQEKLDKIYDKKEEALHLVHRIMTASTLNPIEKESLLNQAIEELNEKLTILLHAFKNESLPHYT